VKVRNDAHDDWQDEFEDFTYEDKTSGLSPIVIIGITALVGAVIWKTGFSSGANTITTVEDLDNYDETDDKNRREEAK